MSRHFLYLAVAGSIIAATSVPLAEGQVLEDRKGVTLQLPADTAKPSADDDWTMRQAWGSASNLAQTGFTLDPPGKFLRINSKVMSLALVQKGKFLVAKTLTKLAIVDADSFQVIQQYDFPVRGDGGSMHGLAVAPDDSTIYFTGKRRNFYSAVIDTSGALTNTLVYDLGVSNATSNPLGVALTPDGKTAVVALAVANQVAVVNLASTNSVVFIPVGICPYDVVVTPDGKTAFVSNFGGCRPKKGDKTEKSAGSDVAVDDRSVALRGTVSVIDLPSLKVVDEIVTRIHPEAMVLSRDGKLVYVVDASGDGISVISIRRRKIIDRMDTKPRGNLPFGSLTSSLAFSADGLTLFACNAGNNAVALLDPAHPDEPPHAFIEAGGYPGAVCTRSNELFVANVLTYGGDLQKVVVPKAKEELERLTRGATKDFHLLEMLRANVRTRRGAKPRPVPANLGEPSSIKHVVYIIKENKKFDQMLGDIGRGNCEPKFCEFPRNTSPNMHALADEFVLLDNYYCSGICSSDGHQWAVQGLTTPYQEKDFHHIHSAYNFGTDPLCYAGCGFIWDHLLRNGISFRNFGEMDISLQDKGMTWGDFYDDWKKKTGRQRFRVNFMVETLRRYSDARFPGWGMEIPDQVRADVFLTALDEFEKAKKMPSFIILYLPNDHTMGGGIGWPTPRAYVADNDLALGRVIEGLSKSSFWKDMVVFANEDDPQTGVDHVDGHRSLCLLAGPYVKRGGTVVSRFYNQSSVLHTICRIFGVAPMNQLVAMSPLMTDCFRDEPDYAAYTCRPANIPLDEVNPDPKDIPSKTQARLAPMTEKLDFSGPDRIDDDAELFSRYVWSTVRGDEPFPIAYFGAHGKGLKALGLCLAADAGNDGD